MGMYPHFQKKFPEGENNIIKNTEEAAKTLLISFREYLETEIRGFLMSIIEADKYVENLTKPESLAKLENLAKSEQATVEHNNNVIRDKIGDRCREVWRRVKKCYQQVEDIGNKYKLINEVGNFNVPAIEEDFKACISSIYERLNEEWGRNESATKNYEQLCRLMKKCEIFREVDG
jgi:hypothetical protein